MTQEWTQQGWLGDDVSETRDHGDITKEHDWRGFPELQAAALT